MGRALQWLGVGVGAYAIVMQFWLNVTLALEKGTSVVGTLVAILFFFTILTNIFVFLVHLAGAIGLAALGFFRRPVVQATAAVNIAVVCIVYYVVLARLWSPQGLQFVLDKVQHYVAPAIMVLWWLGWGRTGTLRLSDVPSMLVYPLAYLAAVLIRAPIAGLVPYPFLDYGSLGWPAVGRAILIIALLFAALSAAAVALDRWLPRRASN